MMLEFKNISNLKNQLYDLVYMDSGSTGWIRIQCWAIVGSISGQDYYEFGVNETWIELDQNKWYISGHLNWAHSTEFTL